MEARGGAGRRREAQIAMRRLSEAQGGVGRRGEAWGGAGRCKEVQTEVNKQ